MKKPKLTYGIEFNGSIHDEFYLRLPTIGDNIEAVTDAAGSNGLAVNVAILARCLVRLGDIPKEQLNYEFLRDNLLDDDYDVLWGALAELKKKRSKQKSDSSTSASSS